MKKFLTLVISLLVLVTAGTAWSITTMGEAEFKGILTGLKNYVDWIVTNDGPIVTTAQETFVFVHGNANLYDTGSIYYYYYQFENYHNDNIVAFSLNVNPNTVLTAGYMVGVDLDAAPFSHAVVGDHEAAWNPIVDPASAVFNPGGIAPNVSYNYDPPGNCLCMNDTSTVMFISCLEPPVFKFSTAQNGESWNGQLPVPKDPIPEPMSFFILLIGLAGLVLKKIR